MLLCFLYGTSKIWLLKPEYVFGLGIETYLWVHTAIKYKVEKNQIYETYIFIVGTNHFTKVRISKVSKAKQK